MLSKFYPSFSAASLPSTGDYTRESAAPPSQQGRSSSAGAPGATTPPYASQHNAARSYGSALSTNHGIVRAEQCESLGRVNPAHCPSSQVPVNPPPVGDCSVSMGQLNRLNHVQGHEPLQVCPSGKYNLG